MIRESSAERNKTDLRLRAVRDGHDFDFENHILYSDFDFDLNHLCWSDFDFQVILKSKSF